MVPDFVLNALHILTQLFHTTVTGGKHSYPISQIRKPMGWGEREELRGGRGERKPPAKFTQLEHRRTWI